MTKADSEVLVELFGTLTPIKLTGLQQFAASPIPGYLGHRIARDPQQRPALLLSVIETPGKSAAPPIMLRHIEVQHDLNCHIKHASGEIEAARFTVVRCCSDNPLLQSMFLRVCLPVLQQLGPEASRSGVLDAVNRLVELFRSLEKPARQTIVGLWAELFVIEGSADPGLMVSAWHSAPSDLYDFNSGQQRLEVKASSCHARKHHFRFEQLRPPQGTSCLVASVFVDSAGRGISVTDLVESTIERLDKVELQNRLHGIVFQSLGENWEAGVQERFDYEMARESLSFYSASQIPCICLPIPEGVSEIHFVSDLSSLDVVSGHHLESSRDLFAAASRRHRA